MKLVAQLSALLVQVLQPELSSVEVVHVWWLVCCGLGFEEAFVAACVAVHVCWLLLLVAGRCWAANREE